MTKYRRIEVNAFRRRVTIVSGEWRPGDLSSGQSARTDDVVAIHDSDLCVPIEPDSPEGQELLADAVRTLEQRLTPAARAPICPGKHPPTPKAPNQNYFCLKLRSTYDLISRVLRFTRKEKGNAAAKQSVED